jgi:DHA2 family multidrug resistance protein
MNATQSVGVRVTATAGLMLASLMNALDSTIANVALPHMEGSLSASQDQITWVLTSYIVATAIMSPLTGWLAQKIGRKTLFLISIAGFVGASVLCGVASSLPQMVIFRLLQGVAGAAMMPLSQAAMFDLWPQPLIPHVMAAWSAVVMVAPILGPTLGGMLTEHYSWRWVFYINVPVGAAAFALVYLFLAGDRPGQRRRLDLVDFGALALFTASIQLFADRGPGLDWFDSREVCVEAVLAACGLYVFIARTVTSEHPLFPRDVLADRNFIGCTIFMFVLTAMMMSTIALLPSFMQTLLGYSALQSGLASMPRGVGALLAFAIVPSLTARFGPRPVMAVGVLLTASSLLRMAYFDLSMTATPIKVAGLIQGFGAGLIFNPNAVLSFATIAPEHRTEAAVLSNTARGVSGSLGIASLQAMLTRLNAAAHETLAARIAPSDPVIRWTYPHLGDGGLEGMNAEVTRQAAMMSYVTVFAWMSLISLCLLPLLLILRPAEQRSSELIEAHAE